MRYGPTEVVGAIERVVNAGSCEFWTRPNKFFFQLPIFERFPLSRKWIIFGTIGKEPETPIFPTGRPHDGHAKSQTRILSV
ncbi:hypothetical protein CDES_05080 [Corynebacterium deserti GIMN1.010]|uniref:Uncharacterized protein n=1 Tax=Corynebacterium deserti GIMN1.010 TaxID=931089 RepID=A0A0M5IFZ5_9CORY|nr:hypothetical protein CDES_05080 [Corynebacterium deserti GIMN1.010]